MRITSINHDSSMDMAVRKLVARQVLAEFSLPVGADYEESKPLIAEALAKAYEAGPVEDADIENLLQRFAMSGIVVGDIHKEAQWWQKTKEKGQEFLGKGQEWLGKQTKEWQEKGKALQQPTQERKQQEQQASQFVNINRTLQVIDDSIVQLANSFRGLQSDEPWGRLINAEIGDKVQHFLRQLRGMTQVSVVPFEKNPQFQKLIAAQQPQPQPQPAAQPAPPTSTQPAAQQPAAQQPVAQ